MKNAVVVSERFVDEDWARDRHQRASIRNPLNKTLHMEIKKARARREERQSKPFNGIRGLDKVRL